MYVQKHNPCSVSSTLSHNNFWTRNYNPILLAARLVRVVLVGEITF